MAEYNTRVCRAFVPNWRNGWRDHGSTCSSLAFPHQRHRTSPAPKPAHRHRPRHLGHDPHRAHSVLGAYGLRRHGLCGCNDAHAGFPAGALCPRSSGSNPNHSTPNYKVAGIYDGEKGTFKEIMVDGTNYAATEQNNSDQIGRAGFYRLLTVLAGAEAPQKTVLPSPIITTENASKFYNPNSVF